MTCSSCGSEVEGGAGFCHLCGAPVVAEPNPVGESVGTVPLRFSLEASALGLFGRSILWALSIPFIVPIPWTLSWFSGWFAGEVEATNGERFRFSGTAANVWKLVALYVLAYALSFGVGFAREQDDSTVWLVWPDVLIQLMMIALSWVWLRWFIDHLRLGDRNWRFDGSVWGFLGWNLLVIVSFLTIIGWAWAMAGMYSWIADHVQDAGGKLRFLGAGHEVLWRSLVFILFVLPIITIPWAVKWYYGWLVSQLELTPEDSAAAVL
jgi:hypothetical protein